MRTYRERWHWEVRWEMSFGDKFWKIEEMIEGDHLKRWNWKMFLGEKFWRLALTDRLGRLSCNSWGNELTVLDVEDLLGRLTLKISSGHVLWR